MNNKLQIVNPHLEPSKVSLVPPSRSRYLLIAAEVDRLYLPFSLWTSGKKKTLINCLKAWCRELETQDGVSSAVVFIARIIPPGRGTFLKKTSRPVHVAKFDIAILIEAVNDDVIRRIQNSENYPKILEEINRGSRYVHIIEAENIKRIAPVDHKTNGVFLFNYFYAENVQQNLAVWEYTAGWFQEQTGLDNSTVLAPLQPEKSQYTIINHCRWNHMRDVLPSLLFKRSFRSFVLANFYANNVAPMPVLYKMA